MLYASLNLEEATLNETKQSISHQSSFILTSFNKNVIIRYILSTRLFKENVIQGHSMRHILSTES
jgi:hypothetical protein